MLHQVLHNQSLLDIATQVDGSVFAVVEWSLANEIPVSGSIMPGQKLEVPAASTYTFPEVAAFFKNKEIIVATNYTLPDQIVIPDPEPEPVLDNFEFPQGEFPISF